MSETSVRRRGRPKGTGKVDPDAIVDAALDALADGGYPALTMRGVARTLGVSLATVQHHYPTKDALWRAAVDHLTNDAIERRSHVDPSDLAGKIATFLEPGSGRPGLLPALLSDRAPGSAQRIGYIAHRFSAALVEPSERLRALEADGTTRHVDHRALFALISIGIGSIPGAAAAVDSIYGFDLTTEHGRADLAAGLADIIGLGILRR
jgi:AcrR family transcriptional regulator